MRRIASKPQMIFFLTAWEQVEVLPQKNRQIADYETGAGEQQAEADPGAGAICSRIRRSG